MNWGKIYANVRMERQRGNACDNEEAKQADLSDREEIAELIATGDAAIVYGSKKANENDENRGARKGLRDGREELG